MKTRRASAQTRLVLEVLSARGNSWRFGYDLSRETGLASGTIYPLLGRLDAQGYLESRWEQTVPGRPPRHLYCLSADGARYVAELEAPTGTARGAGALGQPLSKGVVRYACCDARVGIEPATHG